MPMPPPPPQLDGAEVLYWATSPGEAPFFEMPDGGAGVPIHGLAICRYAKTGATYRFSCDRTWDVQNDSPCASAEEAMSAPSADYDVALVQWVQAR